jgi:hypothetical protein
MNGSKHQQGFQSWLNGGPSPSSYFIAAATMSPSSWAQPSPAGDATVVPRLTRAQADRLAELPLACLQQEYPNKLGQTLGSDADLADPATLHPAFFGCFDWHSAVHGHWSLVALLRRFPDLDRAADARRMLAENLAAENITAEVDLLRGRAQQNLRANLWLGLAAQACQRTRPPGRTRWPTSLAPTSQPLADLIATRYPRVSAVYSITPCAPANIRTRPSDWFSPSTTRAPSTIRNSKHSSTSTARRFYLDDAGCPITWEPGGYDFLSPCLEEIDLMRRVLHRGRIPSVAAALSSGTGAGRLHARRW